MPCIWPCFYFTVHVIWLFWGIFCIKFRNERLVYRWWQLLDNQPQDQDERRYQPSEIREAYALSLRNDSSSVTEYRWFRFIFLSSSFVYCLDHQSLTHAYVGVYFWSSGNERVYIRYVIADDLIQSSRMTWMNALTFKSKFFKCFPSIVLWKNPWLSYLHIFVTI